MGKIYEVNYDKNSPSAKIKAERKKQVENFKRYCDRTIQLVEISPGRYSYVDGFSKKDPGWYTWNAAHEAFKFIISFMFLTIPNK